MGLTTVSKMGGGRGRGENIEIKPLVCARPLPWRPLVYRQEGRKDRMPYGAEIRGVI